MEVKGLLAGLTEMVDSAIKMESDVSMGLDVIKVTCEDQRYCDNRPPPDPSNPPARTTITPIIVLIVSFCLAGTAGLAFSRSKCVIDPETAIHVAVSLQSQSRFSEASKAWSNAEKVGADQVFTLTEKAYTEFEEGKRGNKEKYAASLATCDKVLQIDRSNGRAHYIKGLVYEKIGNTDDARRSYGMALRVLDKEPLAAKRLGGLER